MLQNEQMLIELFSKQNSEKYQADDLEDVLCWIENPRKYFDCSKSISTTRMTLQLFIGAQKYFQWFSSNRNALWSCRRSLWFLSTHSKHLSVHIWNMLLKIFSETMPKNPKTFNITTQPHENSLSHISIFQAFLQLSIATTPYSSLILTIHMWKNST